MGKIPEKDRFACFQWIRDVRAEMARDMGNMTAEESVAYIHARAVEAQKERPECTLGEAKKRIAEFLAETPKDKKAQRSGKTSPRRKSTVGMVKA